MGTCVEIIDSLDENYEWKTLSGYLTGIHLTNIEKIMKAFMIVVIILISSGLAYLSWIYSGYFLSRRDHYTNSKYQLFVKKLGWSISVFFTSIGLLAAALGDFFRNV